MEPYGWGVLTGQIFASTVIVVFLGWCLGFIFRGPYRRHHTRVVITTMLGWCLSVLFTSQGPNGLDGYLLAEMISGPLALGMRIFANPPPVEDEDGNVDMGLEEPSIEVEVPLKVGNVESAEGPSATQDAYAPPPDWERRLLNGILGLLLLLLTVAILSLRAE